MAADSSILGVALVGAGGMAHNYRDNYAALPGVAYRLVVDVDPETVREIAALVGAERWSTDWRDALAPDISLVDISTPNHLHAEQAVAFLQAGKHIILQKPMAPTLAECKAIVHSAQESGTQAAVYMSDLEDATAWDMRDLVEGGFLGRISTVRGRYAHRGGLTAKPSPTNWRGSAEKTGGGAFMQLSIHHTNLVSWILGGDGIESVMAYSANRLSPSIGGDDQTVAVCEFGSGIQGVFESAWNATANAVEIYGTDGMVRMTGGQGGPVEVQTSKPFAGRVINVPDAGVLTRIPASGGTSKQCKADNPLNQHIAFVQAVQKGKRFPVTAQIGMEDVAVVKAVYLSAQIGQRVRVADVLAGRAE